MEVEKMMGQGNMRGSDYRQGNYREPEDSMTFPPPDEDHHFAKLHKVGGVVELSNIMIAARQEGGTKMTTLPNKDVVFEVPSGAVFKPHKFSPNLMHGHCGECGVSSDDQIHEPPIQFIQDQSVNMRIAGEPAVWVERIADDAVTYEIRNLPNEQAKRVVQDILPKALELYLKKSKDYGGNVMAKINLGPKACIPDMQRKFGKLVDAIWWDKPLAFEQPEEILMDLLGHIFIILDEMAEAADPDRNVSLYIRPKESERVRVKFAEGFYSQSED
jgi:hypothetical protein